MPVLSNRSLPLFSGSLESDALRRAELGDSESWLYLVPNRVAERRMERDILRSAAGRALPKLNILTLADLAKALAAKAFPNYRYISDGESAMLIELSIRELLAQNKLTFFERASHNADQAFPIPRGTFELVVNTIRQLKESGIAPVDIEDDLRKSLLKGESTEVRRAKDILQIYQAYHNWLVKRNLMDTYGQTLLVNERYSFAAENDLIVKDFRETFPRVIEVFISGFYYLEPPSVALIARLAKIPGIAVTIELAEHKNNPELFSGLIDLEAKLRDVGFQAIPSKQSERHPLSDYVGSKLFTSNENIERKSESSIEYIPAYDAIAEVEFIAREIKQLYRLDESLRNDLSQIVIATPSAETYSPLFEEVFRRYEIPVQITDRYHLDRSPLVQALLSLLDAARTGLRRRELVRILASPYFDFLRLCGEEFDAPNLIDILTRLSHNSDHEATERSFDTELGRLQRQKENAEDTAEYDRFEREQVRITNALRDLKRLAKALRPLSRELTPSEFCDALRELLSSLRTPEQILSSNAITLRTGTLENDTHAYRALVKLIEEMGSLFRVMGISGEMKKAVFYEHRLKAALVVSRYGTRAKSNAVLVTSLAQSISQPAKYLFLAGLTEGVFPAPYQPQVFLTSGLQKGERRQLLEDRVLFFQAITNFGSKLYLSYPMKSASGAQMNRSGVIDALDEIFTINIARKHEGIFSRDDLYRHASQIDEARFAKLEVEFPNAPWLSTLKNQVPTARRAIAARLLVDNTIFRGEIDETLLSPEERKALEYNKTRVWSITQLELYARCPFRFFARDILGLREEADTEDGVNAMERGSALHEVLRQFLVSRRERKLLPLQDMAETELPAAYREAKEMAENYFQSKPNTHPFWRLDSETLLSDKRPGGSVLWKFIQYEHKRNYELRPRFFEVSFGGFGKASRSPIDSEISQDEPVEIGGFKLRGKIDRIDISKDDGPHFAVIDYKSGKDTPPWKEIHNGISLQLPLYLRVAEDLLRTHIPPLKGVAALYHKVMGTESDRKLGLALQEYAGTAFEKIGQKGKGLLASKEELSELIDETVTKAKGYVDGVAIGAFPLIEKSLIAACKYCPYGSACRIEEAKQADVLR